MHLPLGLSLFSPRIAVMLNLSAVLVQYFLINPLQKLKFTTTNMVALLISSGYCVIMVKNFVVLLN